MAVSQGTSTTEDEHSKHYTGQDLLAKVHHLHLETPSFQGVPQHSCVIQGWNAMVVKRWRRKAPHPMPVDCALSKERVTNYLLLLTPVARMKCWITVCGTVVLGWWCRCNLLQTRSRLREAGEFAWAVRAWVVRCRLWRISADGPGRVVSLIAANEIQEFRSEDFQEGSGREKRGQQLRVHRSMWRHRCVRRWRKTEFGRAKVGAQDDQRDGRVLRFFGVC